MMKIPIIPDWCKGLPDKTKLCAEDLLEFYGLKITPANKTNIYRGIKKGKVLSPSNIEGHGPKRSFCWLLGDLRKQRNEMINKNT